MEGRNCEYRLLKNARIVDPSQKIDTIGDMRIDDDCIVECGGKIDAPQAARQIDCGGKMLIPGLVDARVFAVSPVPNTAKPSLRSAGLQQLAVLPPSS